jgi:peroxiredoxin
MLAAVPLTFGAIGIGDPITDTDVEMKNTDGKMVTLENVKGEKGTLVVFTCNHCPVVKGWQDEMVAIGNTYKDKGVGVIFINSNDPSVKGDTFEGMQELAKEKGYNFPYVVDATSGVAKNFGAKKTPDVFLFDADGKLAYQGAVGEGGRKPKAGGTPYLKNALDALVAGNKIETAQTKAVGCSIKFR